MGNYFNLDYENQKVDNNKDYEKWKDSMIIFYGNDAKLFRCLKDKIFHNISPFIYFIHLFILYAT